MKIVQLLYSGFGGTATVAFSLVDAGEEVDWKMMFYGVEPLAENYKNRCIDKGIDYSFYHKKKAGFFDSSNYKRIVHSLEDIAPDAIICHLPSLIFIARKYCKKHPKTKLIGVEHHALHLKKNKDWILSLLLMRQADYVVYLSEFYRNKIAEKIGAFFKKEKAAVIPNGVNTQIFKSNSLDKSSIEFNIGMMGRLVEGKDIETIVESVCLLKSKGKNIRFLIAGDGPKMEEFNTFVRAKGVEASVVFLGLLAQKELLLFLEELDVYIHSTAGETINTSVMQAMSMELPVVVSDVPEVNTMVVTGENGFLFEKGNASDLADKLMLLIEDGSLRNKMGKQAREIAVEKYSAQRMLEQYLQLMSH